MSLHLPAHLFHDLIDNSIDAVVMIDAQCRIRYANTALEKLVGFGVRELIGEPLNGVLPESVAKYHDTYVKNYLEGFRASMVLGKVREMQVRHRTGELIPVELKTLDLGKDGDEWFFGAFLIDIRQRKQLESKNTTLMNQLHQQALTDALTGLPNRRAFDNEASRLFAVARREGRALSVGVVDIDWFKKVNDTFGHAAGDEILRAVAQTLQRHMRHGDFVGRIGGEEFGLLFRGATLEEAQSAAERLRASVAAMRVFLTGSMSVHVAISAGVAQADPNESIDAALQWADRALYRAKAAGRNKVVAWRGVVETD